MPLPVDLARDFFSVRSPTTQQARLAEAVLDGFLLGYREWELWQYVGRATRAMPDEVAAVDLAHSIGRALPAHFRFP